LSTSVGANKPAQVGDEHEDESVAGRTVIVQAGDPVLRRRARDLSPDEIVGDEIQGLIVTMRDVMRSAPGVGLAAPQIGRSLRIAVIEDREDYFRGADPAWLEERGRRPVPFHVIINPTITVVDGEPVAFFEGCLSIEGWSALVPRARAVRVDCLDQRANPVTISASGWYARILQHEIDHLDGNLYIDHMEPRSFTNAENYARHWKDHTTTEVRAALVPDPLSGRKAD